MPGPEYAGTVVVLRGLPVRLVERLLALDRPARRTRSPACPADVSLTPDYADIGDQLERRSPASRCTRARSSGCSTTRARWPTRCGRTARRSAVLGDVAGAGRAVLADEPRLRRRGPSRLASRRLAVAPRWPSSSSGPSRIRLVLLPTDGLRGDIDQFVGWVHHIAIHGWRTLYGRDRRRTVTFGPVMVYIWALAGAPSSPLPDRDRRRATRRSGRS